MGKYEFRVVLIQLHFKHTDLPITSFDEKKNKENKTMMNKIDMNSDLNKVNGGTSIFEFQKMYPTRGAREKALRGMSNEEIDEIISSCGTPQGKAYYASFKR